MPHGGEIIGFDPGRIEYSGFSVTHGYPRLSWSDGRGGRVRQAGPGPPLDRRAAVWAVRGLADAVPLLFVAPERHGSRHPSRPSPRSHTRPLTAGGKIVEDYWSTGLSFRQHPTIFLRGDLGRRGMVACADLVTACDRRA